MNPFVVFAAKSAAKKVYSTGFRYGRAYVGRQIKTYTTKPKTWADKAWLAAEGIGWYVAIKPHFDRSFPGKTDNMVAPYMMERRYP